MSRINWGMDLGIPLGVGVADVLIAWWDDKRLAQNPASMQFEPIFGPVAAIAGYGMMAANWQPEIGEVVAHSSVPLAVRSAWAWAKNQSWFPGGGTAGATRRAAVPVHATPVQRSRSVSYGYPASVPSPEFNKVNPLM